MYLATSNTNDQCSTATQILTLPYIAEGNTDSVTLSNASCTAVYYPGFLTPLVSRFILTGLWYYIAGTGDVLKADTCDDSTEIDTIIQVYEGGCTSCVIYVCER